MKARRGLSPLLAALTAAALLAAPPGAGAQAKLDQGAAAEEAEALKKQLADLKKQVQALKAENEELRQRERDRAAAAAAEVARAVQEAQAQRARAEKHFREAMQAVDRLLSSPAKGKEFPDDKAARELL